MKKTKIIIVLELILAALPITWAFLFGLFYLIALFLNRFTVENDFPWKTFTPIFIFLVLSATGLVSIWWIGIHLLLGKQLGRSKLWKTGIWIGIGTSIIFVLFNVKTFAFNVKTFAAWLGIVGIYFYGAPIAVALHFLSLLKNQRLPARPV